MKTYQEYLAENGATQEEIAVLATPKAIAAYNKIWTDAEKQRTEALAAAALEHDQKTQEWWQNEYQPGLNWRDAELLKVKGENAQIRATLEEAKRLGLTQVAIDAGHEPDAAAIAAADAAKHNPPGFNPKEYIKVSDIESFMDKAGSGLADMQELAAEHFELFGRPLTGIEAMRKMVVASRGQKTLRTVWEEQHKVADKRNEIAAKKQQEHDDKIRQETEARIRQEYSANPSLGIPRVSKNSFTQRPSEKEGKKFFELDPNAAKRARIEKYAGKVQ